MKTFFVFKLIELQTTAEATGSPWLSSRETDSWWTFATQKMQGKIWRCQCFSVQLLFTFKSLVLSKSAYWWMYDEFPAAWGLAQASWPNPPYSCCSAAKRSVEALRKLLEVGWTWINSTGSCCSTFSIRKLASDWAHYAATQGSEPFCGGHGNG